MTTQEVIANEPEATESKFNLRPLKATDIKPLSQIISKIGVNQFAPVLRSEEVMGTFKALAEQGDAENKEFSYAGITAVVEIISIIFDNYGKCETELFSFMASVSGLTLKQVENLEIDEFAELLGAIVKMDSFSRFFKVARGLFQ